MQTFEARVAPRGFWAAVLIPPLVYWLMVEGFVNVAMGGEVSLAALLGLMVLAYGMPLAALAWTVSSVAAYSVGPGRLVLHRAMGDRTYPLEQMTAPPALSEGAIELHLAERNLVVHPLDVAGCWRALHAATRPAER